MNVEYAVAHAVSVRNIDERIIAALNNANFGIVYVKGEVVEWTVSGKGHIYLTLKHIVEEGEYADKEYEIKAAIYKNKVLRGLSYSPERNEAVGKAIIAKCTVSFYEPYGSLSLIVDDIILAGAGEQAARIAALKEALRREGVFDRPKRPIPKMPSKICVITSLSEDAKALSDLCKGFRQHNPLVEIIAIPAIVGGDMISTSVPEAIRKANETDADFIVLARGGGGGEDVVTRFSNEPVVRAVLGSQKPIVSAIGHHTDHPLCDDVADMRASVPNQTASVTVSNVFTMLSEMEKTLDTVREKTRGVIDRKNHNVTNIKSLIDGNSPLRLAERKSGLYAAAFSQINGSYQRLLRGKEKAAAGIYETLRSPSERVGKMRTEIAELRARLDKDFAALLDGKEKALHEAEGRVKAKNPKWRIDAYRSKLDEYPKIFAYKADVLLRKKKDMLNEKAVVIDSLNPLAVLIRGYSVAYKGETVLKSVSQVSAGDTVRVRLNDGEFKAEVKELTEIK